MKNIIINSGIFFIVTGCQNASIEQKNLEYIPLYSVPERSFQNDSLITEALNDIEALQNEAKHYQ